MTLSAADLAGYLGVKSDLFEIGNALNTGIELVDGYLAGFSTMVDGQPVPVVVPETVVDRAVLEVAAELFHRKQTKNGISQFATVDTPSPMRIARDPLVAARPLLAPYLTRGGFA